MLTLTRRIGERIIVGDNVIIEVLDVRSGDRAVLGISAPLEVRIDREEVRRERETRIREGKP